MFRPAKLGRDCAYAISDPAHEFIAGLTETALGPLANHLGVEGQRVGLLVRNQLYQGRTPDGGERLLTGPVPRNYRPVIGGNFHASKTLDLVLSSLPSKERRAAERLYVMCCRAVVEEHILPQMASRTGRAGDGEPLPAKAMAVLFKHGTNSAKDYHLHVLLEVHNAGLCPDGKVRTLNSEVLFKNQTRYSLEAEALVMRAFHRRYGLVLRPGPNGSLEVKGLEPARDVPTRRQGQILDFLARQGLARTPENVHDAARATHARRDPGLTADAAARNTLEWFREQGIDPRAVVIEPPCPTSALAERKMAESAVVRALLTAERLAARFTFKSLHQLALREGMKLGGADPKLIADTISDLSRMPDERAWFGIRAIPNGLLTTDGIERAHARLYDAVRDLGRSGKVMSGGVAEPAADLRPTLDAFRAFGNRVHVVGGPGTAAELDRSTGVTSQRPEAFAARVGDVQHRAAFLDALGPRARAATALDLGPADVVVLDVRRVGAWAAAHIAEAAARAGSSVVVVGRLDPPTRDRVPEQERGVDRR